MTTTNPYLDPAAPVVSAEPPEPMSAPEPADAILAASSRYALAYERHLPEMQALDPAMLLVINVDIPTATTLVQARLRGIRALRKHVAKELPYYDLARFDALESCTRAASYAHALYLIAAAPVQILPELSDSAIALRDQLASDLTALARRDLVDPTRLGELKGPIGYKNVAYDLMALASLLRSSWSAIAGKTAIEPSEIDEAERLADELLTGVAEREDRPEKLAEAGLDRQRAFTLFARTYGHVRRAVTFLRWEERDADIIAPSLYSGRSNGRRKEPAEPTLEPSAPGDEPAAAPSEVPALPDGDPFVS